MPKVSIITTTYKHERFISQTIESILNQSFTDWELLIGDDSPDDATGDIIQEYVRKYPDKIRVWQHFPNKGIVGNMNFLLSQISEESQYISFLEGDDLYTRNYLEEKMRVWTLYPDLWLVYNELSIIDDVWDILEHRFIWPRTRKWYKNETNTIGRFLTSDMVCFSYSTLMVKRYDGICIRDLGRDDLMGSETDFWLQIASRSPIYGIEEPLTFYRKHSWNTSKDLSISIGHYEYLVNYYYEQEYISGSDMRKLQILIAMMRIFDALHKGKFLDTINLFVSCLRISLVQTLISWFVAIYYRLLKPKIVHIFYR
jgi:glycosyltransferase involved in cell wall biosynthesis